MNSHKNAIKKEYTDLYNHRTDIVPPNCPIRTKFIFDGSNNNGEKNPK
jgi:hypothetical protein